MMGKIYNNFGIYGICSLSTGQLYIGSTAISFRQRYWQHFWHLSKNKHHNKHLQNIYNKYGSSNLIFFIVEIVSTPEEALIKEQEYFLNWKPDINKAKHSKSALGCKHPPEAVEKRRLANKGKKRSIEQRLKSSIDRSEHIYVCYDFITKQPIASFQSISCAVAANFGTGDGINGCIRGKQLQHNGFSWTRIRVKEAKTEYNFKNAKRGTTKGRSFKRKPITEIARFNLRKGHKKIAVTAFCAKTNEPYLTLLSMGDAKQYGFDDSTIWKNLKYPNKAVKKYKWIKVKEYY